MNLAADGVSGGGGCKRGSPPPKTRGRDSYDSQANDDGIVAAPMATANSAHKLIASPMLMSNARL